MNSRKHAICPNDMGASCWERVAEQNVFQEGYYCSLPGMDRGGGTERGCSRQPSSWEVWSGADVGWQPRRTPQSQRLCEIMIMATGWRDGGDDG